MGHTYFCYAFLRSCMLLYTFIPSTPFYLLLMYKLSPPQQQQQDRWSRVNRLYLAEAGKNKSFEFVNLLRGIRRFRIHGHGF